MLIILRREEGILLEKIFTGFLTVALLVLVVLPVLAQEYENDNISIEFNYSPMTLSGGNGFSGDLTAFNAKAEVRIYRGLKLGANYTWANGGSGSFNRQTHSNVTYYDFEGYLKVPMNLASLSESYDSGATRAENPFFFLFGYKNHQLNSSGSPTNTNFNWENGNGIGAGLGLDGTFEGIAVYGLFAYYPSMTASNVPNAVPGVSYTFRDIVYRAGLRFKLRENIEAHLGYRGETHVYSNTELRYQGPIGGINFKF